MPEQGLAQGQGVERLAQRERRLRRRLSLDGFLADQRRELGVDQQLVLADSRQLARAGDRALMARGVSLRQRDHSQRDRDGQRQRHRARQDAQPAC